MLRRSRARPARDQAARQLPRSCAVRHGVGKGQGEDGGAPATLTLGRYLAGGNRLFSFHGVDAERRGKRNGEDELIVAVKDKAGDGPVIQTGNYVGRFTFQKLECDFASRFGDAFMQRMLIFANDIYVDDGFTAAERVHAAETDYARALLFMMFVQALEKAFLLGLPKPTGVWRITAWRCADVSTYPALSGTTCLSPARCPPSRANRCPPNPSLTY